MDKQSLSALVKDWGYRMLPPPHPRSLGHGGLVVAVRKEPTGLHFDPERLHLRLVDATGRAKWTTVSRLSPLEGTRRLCPGIVSLHDRSGRRVDFFAFGGSVEPSSPADQTVVVLRSPAPVLELTAQKETVADQLADETELLMAEAEAKWGPDEAGFERRLAGVGPLEFYLAVLHTILGRYQPDDILCTAYHDLCAALEQEKEWLVAERFWPAKPRQVEELLAA